MYFAGSSERIVRAPKTRTRPRGPASGGTSRSREGGRAETKCAAARIGKREHDPLAEAVDPALARALLLRQPGGDQLLEDEAVALRPGQQLVPATRRPADA